MIWLFFAISIIFSFLCSIWEAVLLSIPPSTVEIEFQKGTFVGKTLKAFKENIDRPLAAILTLNTLAHTVGAMGVGHEAGSMYGDSLWATVGIPALMTLGILILSEIIPKTLGANNWKRLISFTVQSVNIIIYVLLPLVWISNLITKLLKKDKEKSVLNRSDFTAMAAIGEREGVFREGESRIIKNLMRFNTIRAKDIMTPRIVVEAVDDDTTIEEYYNTHKDLRFSRIPIYKEQIDEISGFFLRKDMLGSMLEGRGQDAVKTIARPVSFVNDSMAVPDLFNNLMEKREHMAIVVGEFGGMQGLVTMEDVIETLLGLEIMDELDNIEDMQVLARKNWENRAKRLGLISKEEQSATEVSENGE